MGWSVGFFILLGPLLIVPLCPLQEPHRFPEVRVYQLQISFHRLVVGVPQEHTDLRQRTLFFYRRDSSPRNAGWCGRCMALLPPVYRYAALNRSDPCNGHRSWDSRRPIHPVGVSATDPATLSPVRRSWAANHTASYLPLDVDTGRLVGNTSYRGNGAFFRSRPPLVLTETVRLFAATRVAGNYLLGANRILSPIPTVAKRSLVRLARRCSQAAAVSSRQSS